MKFLSSLAFLLCAVVGEAALENKPSHSPACRNIPGSSGYPDAAAWNALNATISGRLVDVVPSAKYCASLPGGACTDAEWSSALFRSTIPGAMDQVRLNHLNVKDFMPHRFPGQLGAGPMNSLYRFDFFLLINITGRAMT
jgi:hypothetical protein